MFVFRWFFLLGSCCLALCLFLFPIANREKSLLKKIHEIPSSDRWAIESFFRIFLLKDAGAYTLFWDKPVTFDSYFDSSPDEMTSSSHRYCLENKQMREGWETWEKHQHLFPSNRFLLKARRLDNEKVEIILINKPNFIKMINKNLSAFQAVIGEKISASELLKRYERGNLPLFDLLKRHHGLLGILLGFGKRNAWLFQNRDRILDNFQQFTLKINPLPSPGFKTLEEERSYYQNTLTGAFTEDNCRKCYKFLYLPGFVVDPDSPETQELREKYVRQREQIHDIYSHGDFLETTLKRFCQD